MEDRNIGTSLLFESENFWGEWGLKLPGTTRLYGRGRWAAPKIIPSAANAATKLFLSEAPTKTGDSPIGLLVPGKLVLAGVKDEGMVRGIDVVLTNPP